MTVTSTLQPTHDEARRSRLCRPFLKWAGGKQWLAPALTRALEGIDFNRYVEPFLGGGAVFFALRPVSALLGDSNAELVLTYQVVRDSPEELIAELSTYPHDSAFYYGMRKARPTTDIARAARLLYFNKTAYNGLYRVNARGDFNVPFGSFVNPGICQPDRIRAASLALSGVDLLPADFKTTLLLCQQGDLAYLDPPYITRHSNNGFLKYNAHLFDWDQQKELAAAAAALVRRGVTVIVSNAKHESVASLYSGVLRHYSVSRQSSIGADRAARRGVAESLFTNLDLSELCAEGLVEAISV